MDFVSTVRGPVHVDELGVTLMHEHIFVLSTEVAASWDTGWDRTAQIASAVERLGTLNENGIGTIVDLTVPGLGRNIGLIREVAEKIDLNIVVATGYYTYDSLPHYFTYRNGRTGSSPDSLDEFFLADIRCGIEGSGIIPGMLKCATDAQGVTPDVERILRSVARVHRQTGIPISTHTHAHTRRGLEQQAIFAEEGVDLGRVVIGHCGDTTDLGYLEEILRAGSTIGMDRFGLDVLCSFDDRVETVAELVKRGWSAQIIISHDAACHFDWFDDDLRERIGPDWNFLHITNEVVPALTKLGVTAQQLETMMVENPKRLLLPSQPY